MKIVVIGAGYVGYSLSILLAKKYNVIAVDIDKRKVELINSQKPVFNHRDIIEYLKNNNLNLKAVKSFDVDVVDASYVIICTPTNYMEETHEFNTKTVEKIIEKVTKINKKVTIIIKSTVPIGFTEKVRKKYTNNNIFFSPEFLRENMLLHDNQYPSRIIVGGQNKSAEEFANILKNSAEIDGNQIPTFFMSSKEAESVKLFSNTYLASRVSFFNELDSFCEVNGLETKNVILGMSGDPRIGNYYNNPSFGYGGYCLPKDTKQLLNNYRGIPNKMIAAVIESNKTRKEFIAQSIINMYPKTIGVYRLVMKSNSDNFRDSAIFDIIKLLLKAKIDILIYEPIMKESEFIEINAKLENQFQKFAEKSDIIIANRISDELDSVKEKVYTRDIFQLN